MTSKFFVSSSNPSIEKVESVLSEGGHYYQTFLKPALIEGLSALGAGNSFLLSEIYYGDACYADDDLSLSEELLCSIPEARSLKHQALDALCMKINDQTGIFLSRERLSQLLKVTREEKILHQKHGTIIEDDAGLVSLSGAIPKLIQLVFTIQYLTARTTRLFGDRLYYINYIGSPQEQSSPRPHAAVHSLEDKDVPEGITLKTIDFENGQIELIVDGRKNFYLIARRFDTSIPAPTMQIAWPNHQMEASSWIHPNNQKRTEKSWMPIGFLDASDLFVLRLAGEDIRFENMDVPLSISFDIQ